MALSSTQALNPFQNECGLQGSHSRHVPTPAPPPPRELQATGVILTDVHWGNSLSAQPGGEEERRLPTVQAVTGQVFAMTNFVIVLRALKALYYVYCRSHTG